MNTIATQQRNYFNQFLLLWAGQLVSAIGIGLTAFTLGVYIFQTTDSATSYSLTILCAFLPSFLLTPISGVFADRYDRRLLIVFGDTGAIVGIVYILLCMISGNVDTWQIYLGIIISSIFTALHSPAYKATITDMLPPEKYEQASGLVQLAGSAQYLISPLIAGMLMSVMDVKYILIINVVTFIFAIVTVLIVRRNIAPSAAVKPNQNSPFMKEMAEGFQTIVSNKGVLSLVGIISLVLFFVGVLQSLFGPMLLAFNDAKSFGTAQSVCACGMLVSSLIIGIFGIRKNLVFVLSLCLGLMGLFYAALSLTTQIVWIVIPGFLFFFTLPFINASIEVLLRNNIDKNKQGRAWSFVSVMTHFGSILAYCSAGFLADRLFNPLFADGNILSHTFIHQLIGTGPGRGIAFMFLVSGLCIVGLATCIFRSPSVRALEKNVAHPKQEI